METSNRFRQVSWLRELAGDIATWAGGGTAEEEVEFWLDQPSLLCEQFKLPSWFDEHDLRLLTRMVERRIA